MWSVGGANSEDTADDLPHCILRQSYLPPISVRLGLTEYGRFWSLLFTVSFLWDAAFSQQPDKSTDTINPDYIVKIKINKQNFGYLLPVLHHQQVL